MSASYDKNQKFKFLNSNVYQILPKGPSKVLKAEDLNKAHASVQIKKYVATEMIGKRVARPAAAPKTTSAKIDPVTLSQSVALKSMKENLKVLNDLQARLRFVLKELENLVQE